jgi:hypothetical protein
MEAKEYKRVYNAVETAFTVGIEKSVNTVYALLQAHAESNGVINIATYHGAISTLKESIKAKSDYGYQSFRKFAEEANRALKTVNYKEAAVYSLEDFANYAGFAALVKTNYESQKTADNIKEYTPETNTDGTAKEATTNADGTTKEATTNAKTQLTTELMGILSKLNEDNLRLLFDEAAAMLEEQTSAAA